MLRRPHIPDLHPSHLLARRIAHPASGNPLHRERRNAGPLRAARWEVRGLVQSNAAWVREPKSQAKRVQDVTRKTAA